MQQVKNPDEIITINIDKNKLPANKIFKKGETVVRQVVNIKFSKTVVEYRVEVLIDENGKKYHGEFPEGVTQPIQYGNSVKEHSCFLSTYQLIPYGRIEAQFRDQYDIPLSTGSIYNFNSEASKKLEKLGFDKKVKEQLINSKYNHADETSINVNGTNLWLHDVSNGNWTYFMPHEKRGAAGMDHIGIIPVFQGALCHDHWKPYFTYKSCTHVLCNAHHLRELTFAHEQDDQQWAKQMYDFLLDLNKEVNETKAHHLPKDIVKQRQEAYQKIIKDAENECPAIEPLPGKKRKPKQGKSRNLLNRLRDYGQKFYYLWLLIMSHSPIIKVNVICG